MHQPQHSNLIKQIKTYRICAINAVIGVKSSQMYILKNDGLNKNPYFSTAPKQLAFTS